MPTPRRFPQIESQIRGRILSGLYAPGQRLPTRRELSVEFSASSATVQKAMHRLIVDGFLVPGGRGGTRVSMTPPHRMRYGMIFSFPTLQASFQWTWTGFHKALRRRARDLGRSLGLTIEVYVGLQEGVHSEDYHRLDRDLERQTLGGLIAIQFPRRHWNMPLFQRPLPPIVGRPAGPGWAGCELDVDYVGFIRLAIEHLQRTRRRRLALIAGWSRHETTRMIEAARAAGLDLPRERVFMLDYSTRHTAGNICRALMQTTEPPQAILVPDDNFLAAATAGLRDHRRRKIDVIGWCNYPVVRPHHVPVTFIGLDVDEYIRAGINLVDRQRDRKRCPQRTLVESRMFGTF